MSRPRKKPEEMSFPELVIFADEMRKQVSELQIALGKLIPVIETVRHMASDTSAAMDIIWMRTLGGVAKKPNA